MPSRAPPEQQTLPLPHTRHTYPEPGLFLGFTLGLPPGLVGSLRLGLEVGEAFLFAALSLATGFFLLLAGLAVLFRLGGTQTGASARG